MASKAEGEKYEKAVKLAENVVSRVGTLLSAALGRVGNPELVRGTLEKPRLKELSSIVRKAKERGWSVEDAIERCWDFVGFRLVCNNLQDVKRAADLFEQSLKAEGLQAMRHDYIAKPQPTGYRAIHLTVGVPLAFGQDQMTLGCEVQIRTRLQHAWGELSRADFYGTDAPAQLGAKMASLAKALARADRIAEQIRVDVTKPRKGRRPPASSALTASGLAFVYRRRFDEDPPQYVIDSILRELGGTPIRADALDQLLHDEGFVESVREEYSKHTRWQPFPDQVFQFAVRAAHRGAKSAIALARRTGQADWQEIDAQYKSELSHAVPDTWEELREQFQDGSVQGNLDDMIHYFEADKRCYLCGEATVSFDSLAAGIVEHYKIEDDAEVYETVTSELHSLGYDDSGETAGLCNYHHYVLNKDD